MTCELNSHWAPYYFTCGYCQAQYSLIGRLENFSEDLMFIQRSAGIIGWNSSDNILYQLNSSNGKSTQSLTKTYFSTLNETLLREVYNLYKIDFEMFEYEKV